jgi:hypothetical protein
MNAYWYALRRKTTVICYLGSQANILRTADREEVELPAGVETKFDMRHNEDLCCRKVQEKLVLQEISMRS